MVTFVRHYLVTTTADEVDLAVPARQDLRHRVFATGAKSYKAAYIKMRMIRRSLTKNLQVESS